MCKKSPAVNYVYKKISTTRKSELFEQLKDSPLTERELDLIDKMVRGQSIVELSDHFHLSYSRISEWKREVCEKIHSFDLANLKR